MPTEIKGHFPVKAQLVNNVHLKGEFEKGNKYNKKKEIENVVSPSTNNVFWSVKILRDAYYKDWEQTQ